MGRLTKYGPLASELRQPRLGFGWVMARRNCATGNHAMANTLKVCSPNSMTSNACLFPAAVGFQLLEGEIKHVNPRSLSSHTVLPIEAPLQPWSHVAQFCLYSKLCRNGESPFVIHIFIRRLVSYQAWNAPFWFLDPATLPAM